jgi:hypothetical protein
MIKNSLLTALAAAAISMPALVAPAMVTPAVAQVDLNVSIGVPPPAPIYEAVPAPRMGYVWAPGYYHWVPDRWARVDGGWRHDHGHWDHDMERHGFNQWH